MEKNEIEDFLENNDFSIKKNFNSFVLEVLREKPIAFNRIFADIAGSATSGLFMSQLLFWYEKGQNKEWIYKTIEEMERETTLSRSEQCGAIKEWKNLGVLEQRNMGVPCKRHFKINKVILGKLLENHIKNKYPNSSRNFGIADQIAKYSN